MSGEPPKPPRILIIAGSDSGGGAGIQADIKTVTALGGFATTAITAVTAQNTLGVSKALPIPAGFVVAQMEAVLDDIGTDAVKIGMIGSAETAEAVAEKLSSFRGNGEADVPIVFDPVMVATSGSPLADEPTIAAFGRLMRVARVVTPNLPELEALTGLSVDGEVSMAEAARKLASDFGCRVVAKGGHLAGGMLVDLLVDESGVLARWENARIETRHTHGTGCTLASAIAIHLGRRRSLTEAVERARGFVRRTILAAPGFGTGHGPMGHADAGSDEMNLSQVTLPARDYAESVAFYTALGLTQIVDSPGRYARFECPGGATLSIHVEAEEGPGGAAICFESGELDAWVARLVAAGIAFDAPPEEKRWRWREAYLRDPAGNRLVLFEAGENRRFPPWRLSNPQEK